MTVHLVYVNNLGFDTSNSIAREVALRLAPHYPVKVHHPNEPTVIRPEPGDILIGHPNRYSNDSVFNRSFFQPGWARRIVFAPLSHGMLADAAGIDSLVDAADIYLAITGAYWLDSIDRTPLSHWGYKTVRCGLGVNRDHYPKIKNAFAPQGARRFLYIGNADPMKGGDYLARLADENPDLHFGWISTSNGRDCTGTAAQSDTLRLFQRMRASRLAPYYGVHWRRREHWPLVSSYDFVINCGRSDALPSDLLEAVSWGLVAIATPQCGFPEGRWLTHIPLDDVGRASRILAELNGAPEHELLEGQAAGFRQLNECYNWDDVATQVRRVIEMPIPVEPEGAAYWVRKRRNQAALRRLLLRERVQEIARRLLHFTRTLPRRALNRARAEGRVP